MGTFYETFLQASSPALEKLAKEYKASSIQKGDICTVLLKYYRIFSNEFSPGIYTFIPKDREKRSYVIDVKNSKVLYERRNQ
ncbi:MAG: hypothetical protein GX478_10160 [Erysipelotrichaceae bacterium]|jgi:hypothetical protein|nr:hypothetical protein [Erysipelotrichaceae bacterium]